MRDASTYFKGLGIGDYIKNVADRLEAAETPREAEVASWFLEAAIRTLLEEKGVQHETEKLD